MGITFIIYKKKRKKGNIALNYIDADGVVSKMVECMLMFTAF